MLEALPDEELDLILPKLELVNLKLGFVLSESGDAAEHVFFPTTAIISLLYAMENGSSAEIGMIGNEGVLGIALFLGGDTMPNRAVIQSEGGVCKMKIKDLKSVFAEGGVFQIILLRFAQALMTQISQTAVCNRLHSLEQHLCRWLLLSHDRLKVNTLTMTQDLIADMLGVRRESVSVAAKNLADKKLIKYARGKITIVDRQGLEQHVCECYEVVNTEYNRLLGRGMTRSFR